LFNTALSGPEVETLYNYGSPIQTLANIPQSSNLKAWYKLDASDIYDSSTTEWNNIEARANNKGSMSCSYNSWSAQALLQSYNSPVERSISIWVRRTASMGYSGVCNQQGVGGAQAYSQFFVWFQRGYTMSFFVPTPNKWVDFGYMAPDTWYHAVLTDTGVTAVGRFKTYWNGEFANSSTDLTYDLGTFTNGFKWAGGGGLGLWSGGNIADGRLFDTVLSASEVETLYNNGAPSTLNNVKPNNLKQWLTFENIDTSVGGGLYDKSGNNNQLTTPLYPWVAARAAGNLNVPISALNGLSSGMSQSNLVQSDLQTVAPYSKYAINFNSANSDYIDCENNSIFDITSALTLSAWVKLSSATSNQFYISKRGSSDAYQISSFSNKAVGMSIWIGGSRKDLIGTTNHVQDVWYHVVGTYDGSYMRVYVNGTEENSVAQTGAIGTTTAKLILGAYDGVGWSLDGNLSNCSIWNTALTPSQVREIYNEGLPSNLHNFSGAAPVAWWKLGEGVSYDSTNLHVRDYIGSNHGVSSSSMDQSDIVNGVGTSNNGTGNGFSAPSSTITNIFSGPYSDKNAVSVNMQSAKTNSGIDTSTPQAT
jgi:hypothetical protein